jgi:cell division protein FtsQ
MNAAATFNPQRSPELPADVRVMNATAGWLLAVLLGLMVLVGLNWFAGRPFFAFRHIRLEGDVTRNSLATIRANATPRLAGSYFTLDLQGARAAFEAVPWVRHAVVRRVWPNQLVVKLEEHQPMAIWRGDEGNDRLVNDHGEIFDANVGDVEDEDLPEFSGDESKAAAILAMYRRLLPVFRPLELTPVGVSLSDRGSWEVDMDDGATLEIGRGTDDEVVARCQRFVGTVTQATARQHREWVRADLRHADGYALSWKPTPAHAGNGTNTN